MFPQDLYLPNRAACKGMSPLSCGRIRSRQEYAEGASWIASNSFVSTETNLNVMLELLKQPSLLLYETKYISS